ncbi:tryptophan synthase, alpha subunit [Desulfofarcimen acetoxidans DSM 771]|uniref:Tryptophan synthase alpha chain n=1 Tax=Desulfofarcimen acetoxidans (strain ATCC 49208 / DSM 771 / KCTC 5769 / VKM B-1644 / 5575) TaxID=485916 RepID=C8W338_DESAS|nr:tryptophan synthase subunit alpha [Desulfofarcimen acetoxidans]ACV61805.1 tryptophan synthase, alpha subunit [Desulfofarcimen acetoxidans DSM 771]
MIEKRLAELRKNGEKALIPFVTAGDPDLPTTVKLVLSMAEAGADVIELGVPFTDPVADGPAIQKASLRSLAGGTNLAGILDSVREIRQKSDIPLVLMTYYNPVFRFGIDKFVAEAAEAGVNGLIMPDVPLEESGPLAKPAREKGIDLIPLVAPNSPEERIKKITAEAGGFIYCVSSLGVTGVRKSIKTDIANFISRVKKYTELSVAVGFGISGPAQAAEMAAYCDAVIVGSALVNLIEANAASAELAEILAGKVRELKAAISRKEGEAVAAV